ncbi:MAG: peptide chain release factor N(5)-glutamine methyltransferase [Chloroflexi bacterium]|nr:peptide chain release factor N(5)-glutamine methyltransferase [Chloroflexota bacterium]
MSLPAPALPETVSAALAEGTTALGAYSDTPALEAQTLLAHLAGRPRPGLLAHPEEPLSLDVAAAYRAALRRRALGEPLPYLLGEWEFYGLAFFVGPQALIPRPETELLVETALGWLKAHPARRLAADIGTGTGIIAISLATRIADLHVTATDVSEAALALARRNAERHAVQEQVRFAQGDLADALDAPVDLLCANLPYIPSAALNGLPVAKFEPRLALDGGPDGLDLIRRLLADAPAALTLGGLALLEIETGQGRRAPQIAREHFPRAAIEVRPDLAGHPRLLLVQT